MSVPILLKTLYGYIEMTGIYSFEIVDNYRNTVLESFLRFPPTSKTVSEGTRSSVNPTLAGNYVIDGGNATKTIDISGEIYLFQSAPDSRARVHGGSLFNETQYDSLNKTGLEEFFKLRFGIIRYRDYTLKKDGKMFAPSLVMRDFESRQLYEQTSIRLKKKYGKVGGLYDQFKLIFHDYDMDDHFYCKLNNFSYNQVAEKNLFIKYDIFLECYDIDTRSITKQFSDSRLLPANALDNYVAVMK